MSAMHSAVDRGVVPWKVVPRRSNQSDVGVVDGRFYRVPVAPDESSAAVLELHPMVYKRAARLTWAFNKEQEYERLSFAEIYNAGLVGAWRFVLADQSSVVNKSRAAATFISNAMRDYLRAIGVVKQTSCKRFRFPEILQPDSSTTFKRPTAFVPPYEAAFRREIWVAVRARLSASEAAVFDAMYGEGLAFDDVLRSGRISGPDLMRAMSRIVRIGRQLVGLSVSEESSGLTKSERRRLYRAGPAGREATRLYKQRSRQRSGVMPRSGLSVV